MTRSVAYIAWRGICFCFLFLSPCTCVSSPLFSFRPRCGGGFLVYLEELLLGIFPPWTGLPRGMNSSWLRNLRFCRFVIYCRMVLGGGRRWLISFMSGLQSCWATGARLSCFTLFLLQLLLRCCCLFDSKVLLEHPCHVQALALESMGRVRTNIKMSEHLLPSS